MIIEQLEVGVFAENCYIVGCKETREGIVIDPGDEVARISRKIGEMDLQIKYILVTHAHLDHVKELNALNEDLKVPVLMHRDDQFLLDNLPAQAAAFGLTCSGIPKVDKYIEEGEKVEFGKISFNVLQTPGHSPGSVTYATEGLAFSGDVLFDGSIGRTDLPGGDFNILINTIKTKLFPLGEGTIVYSGHGPPTTIGREKESNPFLVDR